MFGKLRLLIVALISASFILASSTAGADEPEALEVLEARYGTPEQGADVTERVRRAVRDGALNLPVNNSTMGGDPVPNRPKTLTIRYRIGERERTIEVPERGAAVIGTDPAASPEVPAGDLLERATNGRTYEELRREHGPGVVILGAEYGAGDRFVDVTEQLRARMENDQLELRVFPEQLGISDPLRGVRKMLTVVYLDVDDVTVVSEQDGETLRIAPGLPTPDLEVLSARYGADGRFADVTQHLQDRISNRQLDLHVTPETIGVNDPAHGVVKTLEVTYQVGEVVSTINVRDRERLTIPSSAERAMSGRTFEELRREHGRGLVILHAEYGARDRLVNVTEQLRARVEDDQLNLRVFPEPLGIADPVPNVAKTLTVVYMDRDVVRSTTGQDGEILVVALGLPEAVRQLIAVPERIAEGEVLRHRFDPEAQTGRFTLRSGPDRLSLSTRGEVTWRPQASDVGVHEIAYAVEVDGEWFEQEAHVEVVSREVLAQVGGNLARVDELYRLKLEEGPYLLVPGADGATLLLVQQRQLTILGADGLTVQDRRALPREYIGFAERPDYYVALCADPQGIEVLDKRTLEVIRRRPLPAMGLEALTLHPSRPLSYVSVRSGVEVPRYRFMLFDETSGEGWQDDDMIGRWLAIDPAGRFLIAGYADIYQRGNRLLMNPDRWHVVPEYGNIDWLIRYEVDGRGMPKFAEVKQDVGANGQGLRMSRDGRRVTYLSHVGYPQYSGHLGGWDPTDLMKLPVTYETRDRGTTYDLAYHPSLPIVASPGSGSAVFFHRESGELLPDRLEVRPRMLDDATIERSYFSPDGRHLLLVATVDEVRYLFRLPLKLSAQEETTVQRAIGRQQGAPARRQEQRSAPLPRGGRL